MRHSALHLHPDDTVACALRDHEKGTQAHLPTGPTPVLRANIPLGHKIALVPLAKGAPVVKFGAVIGFATADIIPGDHVHLHNLQGALR